MSDPLSFTRGRVTELADDARALAFSPDGTAVVVSTDSAVAIADGNALRVLGKPAGDIVAWGPCGIVSVGDERVRRFAVAKGKRASEQPLTARSSRDAGLDLIGEDGRVLRTLPVNGWHATLGGELAAIIEDNAVVIVELATGERRARHPHTMYNVRAVLSPDGTRALITGSRGSWEGPVSGPLTYLPERGSIAHGGAYFAIGGAVFRTGEQTPFAFAPLQVNSVALSGDRVCFAGDHLLWLIDIAALASAPAPVGPVQHTQQLAVGATHLAASSSNDGLVCVWQLDSAQLVATLHGHEAIAWASDGKLLVGGDGLQVWDIEQRRRIASYPIDTVEKIRSIHIAGEHVIVRGYSAIAVLDAQYRVTATFGPWNDEHDHTITIESVAASPTTIYIGRGSDHASLAIDRRSGAISELAPASHIACSGDLIALSEWGSARLVSGDREQRIEPFSQATGIADAFVFVRDRNIMVRGFGEAQLDVQVPDSIYAVAAAGDVIYTGGSALWLAERSITDGAALRLFGAGASGQAIALAFDPSGTRLAVGERDPRLHVWELGATPRRIGVLDGTSANSSRRAAGAKPEHIGSISALAFTDVLVACGGTVMIWDNDWSAIGTTEPRMFGESPSRVSRDGKRFVSGGDWGNDLVVFDETGELSRGPGAEGRDGFFDLSDDGALVLVASSSDDATEISVRTDRGERRGTLRIEGKVERAAFDSRGDVVGWVDEKGPFFRWRINDGTVEKWCEPPIASRWGISHITRGAGRIVLWGSKCAHVVDEATGKPLALLPSLARHMTSVAISNNGRRIALGDVSGSVFVYEDARCIAVVSATAEGGWWSVGAEGFTHVGGEL